MLDLLYIHTHFIDLEFNVKRVVLRFKYFKGQHTTQKNAIALLEILSFWDIQLAQIHVVIHVNGRDVVKAVSNAGLALVRSFNHTFQLIVDSLKVQSDVTQMIGTGRRIVTPFNHSGTAQEKLHSIQKELHLLDYELVHDVSTRWNSTYYLFAKQMEQERAI